MEDAVAVEGAPADLGAAADLLAQAEAARAAKRLDEAERLARRALALAPRTPAPFVALAEAALRRQRPADARALAGWANALQPTGRGQLVLGEAAWTEGEVEQAEAALAEARKLGLEGEAAERAEALAGEMR